MKKNKFRKIVLGTILTSTTLLASVGGVLLYKNNSNLTASSFVNKDAHNIYSLNLNNSTKSAFSTTTTNVKPIFTEVAHQPTSLDSHDGEVSVSVGSNFDATKMILEEVVNTSGLPPTKISDDKIVFQHLKMGDKIQVRVRLLDPTASWSDSDTQPINSNQILMSGIGSAKTVREVGFSYTSKPHTIGNSDGKVTFHLNDFDPLKMTVQKFPNSDGDMNPFDPTSNTVEVTHLGKGQFARIRITLKDPALYWSGSLASKAPLDSMKVISIENSHKKVTFTKFVTPASLDSASDGSVIFTLNNFDPTIMDLSLTPGSGGTLRKYDPVNKTVKVDKMTKDDTAQLQIKMIGDVVPGFGAEDSAGNTDKRMLASEEERVFTIDTNGSNFSMNATLFSRTDFNVNPTYLEITSRPTETVPISEDFQFDKTTQKWTFNGQIVDIQHPHIVQINNSSSLGVATTSEFKIFPIAYDLKTHKLTLAMKLLVGNSRGQNNVAISDIKFNLGQNNKWTDGTIWVKSSKQAMISQSHPRMTKPTFESKIVKPKTATSKDGQVIFTIRGFIPTKMRVELVKGTNHSSGQLIKIQSRGIFQVVGLQNQEYAQIRIFLINSEDSWATPDLTKFIQSPLDSPRVQVTQTFTGTPIPTFTQTSKQPGTITSTDGEVVFTVAGFDSSKMVIEQAPGSNGVLGTFTPSATGSKTGKIKVTGLSNGDFAQIQVVFKSSANVWANSITSPIQSPSVPLTSSKVGIEKPLFGKVMTNPPSTTTSTDGIAVFVISNFNPQTMVIANTNGASGTLGNFIVSKTKKSIGTVTVSGLQDGQFAQIKISLKTPADLWENSSRTDILSPKKIIAKGTSSIIGPQISAIITNPKTITSGDGKVVFTISGFDESIMNISLTKNSDGLLGSFMPSPTNIKNGKITISDLSDGQFAQIKITITSGLKFINKTSEILSQKWAIVQKTTGLSAPKFTISAKQPTTSKTNNGEVTFTIVGFDTATMELELAPGSNGALTSFRGNKKNGTISVISLLSGEHAQVQVKLKKSTDLWASGSADPVKSQMAAVFSSVVGKKRVTFTYTKKKPLVSHSNDGVITFTLTNFDPAIMEIKLAKSSKGTLGKYTPITPQSTNPHSAIPQPKQGTIQVTHLTSKENVQIEVSFKDLGASQKNYWSDGTTTPILSSILQVTQSQVGLSKPTFESPISASNIFQPNTDTSSDGEVIFVVRGFDPNKMDVTLAVGKKGLAQGTIQPFIRQSPNSEIGRIKVTGLSNGNHTQIQFTPKHNQAWFDGTFAPVVSEVVEIVQTKIGMKKPIFLPIINSNIFNPKTTTSTDGEVTWQIIGFDETTMKIVLLSSKIGTLGKFMPIAPGSKDGSIKVTGLINAQVAKIMIVPIGSKTWTDGTTLGVESPEVRMTQINIGISKPHHSSVKPSDIIQPKTTKSTDGEVTFSIKGFNKDTMEIKNTFAKNVGGVLGIFRPMSYGSKDGTIKVTDLKSGQLAQITVIPKGKRTWADGTITGVDSNPVPLSQTAVGVPTPSISRILPGDVSQPKTTKSADGEVTFKIFGFDKSKMTFGLVPGSNGSIGVFVPLKNSLDGTIKVTGLKNGEFAQIEFKTLNSKIWEDGKTNSIKSEIQRFKQTKIGIELPKIIVKILNPKGVTTFDGETTYKLEGYDPQTMHVELAPGSNGTIGPYDPKTKEIKVSGLQKGQISQIQFSLKDLNALWSNGSKIFMYKKINSTEGFKIPKITYKLKNPNTTTSQDGEVSFIVDGFVSSAMTVSLDPSSNGILGAFIADNVGSKKGTFKVTGLSNGQQAQLVFNLKSQWTWEDQTKAAIKSQVAIVTQSKVGLVKPKIGNISIKKPTTSSTSDGELNAIISGFDPTTMKIVLLPGTPGKVGGYEATKKTISITGLKNGEKVKFQIVPKNNATWVDGTTKIFSIEKTVTQTNLGITKPKVVGVEKVLPSKDSKFGKIKFTIEGFDFINTKILLSNDSRGTLGIYDPKTKTIEVLGLQYNEVAKLSFSIAHKPNKTWTDGTIESITTKAEVLKEAVSPTNSNLLIILGGITGGVALIMLIAFVQIKINSSRRSIG